MTQYDTLEWIAALPKVELHLHLEGSLRPETLLRLAERNRVDLGVRSPEELVHRYEFNDFHDFLELFLAGLSVLRTAEDFADATVALAAELAEQHVAYVEVNTDDPAYFQTTLTEELTLAHSLHGLSAETLLATQLNALEASYADGVIKARIRASLEATRDAIGDTAS